MEQFQGYQNQESEIHNDNDDGLIRTNLAVKKFLLKLTMSHKMSSSSGGR